ncbi:pilus assembly protein TadG-related protein [Paeniroseomonas aquatica]|uniref:pilus assembly protein TadG-related protein n=1 Tax=Paeniroseomonas aquatica TaxID=373043 RepID=UPI00361A76B1
MTGLGRRGAVALLTALLAVPLVGLVGIATDGARAWLLKSRLYTALDAAALAGARNFGLPASQRDAEVAAMFWTNSACTTPASPRPARPAGPGAGSSMPAPPWTCRAALIPRPSRFPPGRC